MSFDIGDDTWRDPVIPLLCTVVGCGWLFIPIRDKCNGTLANSVHRALLEMAERESMYLTVCWFTSSVMMYTQSIGWISISVALVVGRDIGGDWVL